MLHDLHLSTAESLTGLVNAFGHDGRFAAIRCAERTQLDHRSGVRTGPLRKQRERKRCHAKRSCSA